MKQTSGSPDSGPNPWGYSADQDRLALPTVLLVEDDRDIREVVTTLLDMAGFAVVACDSAECGLNALREQEFDLILTDYALPRHSGMWLLREADSEGLIEGTPVLIVTAHPHVENERGYEVIRKPFDLDELIERVRHRVEGANTPRQRRSSIASAPATGNTNGGDQPKCPEPVELILYVSSQSPRSFAAVKSIEQVLERLNLSRVKLTVCDLSETAGAGVDPAALPATLVRRKAGPRTFILGHITSPELLLELLADCEAEMN